MNKNLNLTFIPLLSSNTKKMKLDQSRIEQKWKELNKPNLKQKVTFFRLLAVSQNAWLGIRESILSIAKSEQNDVFRGIMEEMTVTLTNGGSLAEAMEPYNYFFQSDEIELVRSAQITGNMAQILAQLADELENVQEINQKIKKAMTYPTMVLLIAIGAVIVILTTVLPNIVSMFPNQDSLPGITTFMLGLSDYMKANRYVFVVGFVSIVWGYMFLYNKVLLFKVFIDKLFVETPGIRDAVKTYYMYQFSNLLAQFYDAGVSPVVSLRLLANIFDNYHYKQKMLAVKSDLESGFTLFESLVSSPLFDSILVQIINVWENTGSLPEVLKKMALYYRNSFRNAIDVVVARLDPILMMFVATIVGVIVASIFMPMASMMEAVNSM